MFKDLYLLNNLIDKLRKHEVENCAYQSQLMEYLSGKVNVDNIAKILYLPKSALKIKEDLEVAFHGHDSAILCVTAPNGNSLFAVIIKVKGKVLFGIPIEANSGKMYYLLNTDDVPIFIAENDDLDDEVLRTFENVTQTHDILEKLGDTTFSIVSNDKYKLLGEKLFQQEVTVTDDSIHLEFKAVDGVLQTLIVDTSPETNLVVLDNPFTDERIADSIVITVNPDTYLAFTIFGSYLTERIEQNGYFYHDIECYEAVTGKIKSLLESPNPLTRIIASRTKTLPSDINPYIREVSSLMIEEDARRAVRKVTSSSQAKGVLSLPAKVGRKIMDFDKSIRAIIADMRRAKDDNLKEKLLNDEFIPLLDEFWDFVISGGATYGMIVFTAINPIIAVIIGVGIKVILSWNHQKNKAKILRILNDKIDLIEEEIQDARTNNDLTTKNNLIQIKQQLIKKRDKIKAGRDIASN